MALKELTIVALMNAINAKIPAAKYVRSIFGAVMKPPANGAEPDDIERITCDEALRNFIEVTCGAYKPIMMQVQLNRTDPAAQTPPDERRYLRNDEFPPTVPEDPYDPMASNSENELYLIKFGKKKAKAWPWSDYGYENEKANCGTQINRLIIHLNELKRRHRKYMGLRAREYQQQKFGTPTHLVRPERPRRCNAHTPHACAPMPSTPHFAPLMHTIS